MSREHDLEERKVLLEIIENYKNMPLLWDKEHIDYRCNPKRNIANKMLLDIYRKIEPDAALPTLVKKILNLRCNFFVELRKVKQSIADGGGLYVPTIWYFDAFTFLDSSVNDILKKHRRNECKSIDNSSKSQHGDPLISKVISPSISDEEGSCQHSESHSPVITRRESGQTSESPAKLRKFTNPIIHKNKNNSSEPAGESSQMKLEECELYGKAIGLQLRDLDRKQLTIAQKLISDAIYFANFGLLTQKTYVNLGSPPPKE